MHVVCSLTQIEDRKTASEATCGRASGRPRIVRRPRVILLRLAMLVVLASAIVLDARDVWGTETRFRVGFAQVDITPTRPMPMWGYGARHALLGDATRDPLRAKVVVIEAGDSKLAVVGLDLGRSLGEPHMTRIRQAVRETVGVEHLLISGSHTHHGPILELKDVEGQGKGAFDDAVAYVGELEQKLIGVIQSAAQNTIDARIGWASRHVDMNRNRHSRREAPPRDTELAVIRLDDRDGKPMAVIVNFAAHPTMLEGRDLRWSAEYPGAMMAAVEQKLGAPCVFMQGASGDLSVQTSPEDHPADDDPRLLNDALDGEHLKRLQRQLRVDENEARRRLRSIIASGIRMESFARRLADQVCEIALSCETKVPENPSLRGQYDEFAFESRVNFRNPLVIAGFAIAFFPELAAAAAADLKDNKIRATLTTVLLNGDLALVGGSGEFFCAHALRLKERSYAAKTLFFGYCNGHSMYFPTIEAAAEGGYGADAKVSWVEPGAGETMMNRALVHIFTWQGKIHNNLLAD